MKILTLSFELKGKIMALSGAERANYISQFASEYKPDLLVCAGWSLEGNSEVQKLAKASTDFPKSTLFVEVKRDEELLQHRKESSDTDSNTDEQSDHVMYAICNGKIKRLGEQYFATSGELNSKKGSKKIKRLEDNLENRVFNIGDLQAIALCCGELNVLTAKHNGNLIIRSDMVEQKIMQADIIVNPTHDLMGRDYLLVKKRVGLSTHGPQHRKVAISISNWNSMKPWGDKIKPQSRQEPTLHTLYLNGDMINPIKLQEDNNDFELRQFTIGAVKTKTPKGRAVLPFFELLKTIDPDVSPEHEFDWLFVPNSKERSDIDSLILMELRKDCQKNACRFKNRKKEALPENIFSDEKLKNKRTRKLEYDFYLPKYNLVIEFDEIQHFTPERALTYMHYPKEQFHYDINRWQELCIKHDRKDADPPERDWQRAYRDTIRDLRAKEHGIRLIRLYVNDFNGETLMNEGVKQQVQRLIYGEE